MIATCSQLVSSWLQLDTQMIENRSRIVAPILYYKSLINRRIQIMIDGTNSI